MSKIGRKAIPLGSVKVDVKGQVVHFTGKKSTGQYELPNFLVPHIKDSTLQLTLNSESVPRAQARDVNRIWGLNRALLANKIKGAEGEFERVLQINGLGFKGSVSGNKLVLSIGFTHKIDFPLPAGVSVDIDKTGQRLAFKSIDKELLGQVVSKIRALRPPEPYKGTGIKFEKEVITRKAGKAKAAAA